MSADTGKNGRSAPIGSFASAAKVPSSSSLLFPRTRTGSGDEERRRVGRPRPRLRPHASAGEEVVEQGGGAAVVGRDVHDEEDAVGVVREVREPGLGVPLGHGRRVHELHLHVLELHHPGQRDARRERVVADLGVRVREGGEERGLARVRRAEEDPLAGALALDVSDLDAVPVAAVRGPIGLVLELGKLLAQVREHLLRALVLREEGDHLAQGRELLGVVRRPFESLFGVVVLGREVRGHPGRIWSAPPPRQVCASVSTSRERTAGP